MFRPLTTFVIFFGLTGTAFGGSWAEGLFNELTHNFGQVARGHRLRCSFQLTNNTNQPVHIASIRGSCGCITGSTTDTLLSPGKSTAIEVQMDTSRFTGQQRKMVFVQFDQPQWDEVQLSVLADIREDVLFNPETFSFSRTRRGSSPESNITVTLAGENWKILKAACESHFVECRVRPLDSASGQVSFQVTARLRPDLPVGDWFTTVWLTTDHPSLARLSIPLTVEVTPLLTVSPQVVDLGLVKSGAQADARVIVRADRPFRILEVDGTDSQVTVKGNLSRAASVHVLAIHLKASKPGAWSKKLKVVTDLKEDNQLEFEVTARFES